ncbi:FtsX-like permease family protein [Nonomuraea sp. NPDC050556]|uniref:FtsX-like permease family protein n=1 Tax=Nonomuraea sp. NPDC050556 TaxID=3364369 RepID=UPI0037B1133B
MPLVIKRAFSEPLLLLAAFGSILLATTTLVALTMYASSIAEVGVRRIMETASQSTISATVTSSVTAETFPKIDAVVRDQAVKAYGGAPLTLSLSIRSDSYVMPGQERRKKPELLKFGSYDGLDQHAKLVQGQWPSPGNTGVVEAAIPLAATSSSGFKLGQTFTTRSRLDGKPVQVRISGVFQLDEPFGDRWTGEQLLSRGVEVGSFTTYGPLMVPRETFMSRFATHVSATWTVVPDLRNLTPEQLRPLAEGIARLLPALKDAGCDTCTAGSRLPDILIQLNTASLVARSTMLIPVLQLLLLAAYALMLTARLLADHRRMEVALLRSRGAGSVTLASLAGGEALLVAVPCALIAPFLAPPLLALVNALPWIQASGVRLAPSADVGTFVVSVSVALASAVLLALPALAGARRTYVEEQSSRGRSGGRGLIERAGADLALLVVAGLAIWQLQHYGAPVTATASGDLGIDPLIISGPALALLTGGMLGLRLVPRISKLAERLTTRRPSLAPALGAWQVSRRPLRYAGPALLLTMAIAIGIVSMSTAATWRGSQLDQARHQAGADLRVSGPAEEPELGSLGRGTAFASLPGVRAAAPAFRGQIEFGGEDAVLVGLDADRLGELFQLRPDLSSSTVGEMAAGLRAARPESGTLPIPGRPRTLGFDVRVTRAGVPLQVTLSDGLNVWHEAQLPPLQAGLNHVELDLRQLAGKRGALTYPLTVRAFTARSVPGVTAVNVLTMERITADGTPLTLPKGARWAQKRPQEQPVDVSSFALNVTWSEDEESSTYVALPAPAGLKDGDLFAAPRAPEALINKPLPVVLTAALAAKLGLAEGRTADMTMDRLPISVKVAAIVDRMPTTEATQNGVLADWTSLQGRALAAGQLVRPATEWWLSAGGEDTGRAVAALRGKPEWNVTYVDRVELATKLRDDPLASGLQGALILGFAAALVFAALGFLVNATVAARERMGEFTILRALGVSFRQVFGLLAIEQAFIIGLSLVAGTVLAVVVGALVVPHIVLTGQASAVTPDVILDIPWPATAAMLALVAAVLFAIVAGLARNLRRQGLGRVLRIGEDQ